MAKIPLHDYKDVCFFEWLPESVETGASSHTHEGVCFIPTDLASVTIVREYFEKKGELLGLSEQQNYELALISDELIANGIIATSNKESSEHVVLRYKISADSAILSVMDYGGGFDILKTQKEIPDGDTLNEFLESLNEYRSNLNKKVRVCGKLIDHSRLGRGLRIVTGLSDAIMILFHNENGKLSRTLNDDTLGTIISVRYKLNSQKL